jgi:hypothetical protein
MALAKPTLTERGPSDSAKGLDGVPNVLLVSSDWYGKILGGVCMFEILVSSVVSSLAAGAMAKAKRVGVGAISGAYDGLKKAVIEELGGKKGAVDALEEDPDSSTALKMVSEQLGKQAIANAAQLETLATQLKAAIETAQRNGEPGLADIKFGDVRGKTDAIVSDLKARGSISFGSVVAEMGSATVRGLRAGVKGEPDSGN